MDNLNRIISQNLKKVREERGWSLDKVAQETGVSKSMLGQIERGESNPTVATVWKISQGMKISFTTLISHPKEDPELLRAAEVDRIEEDEGRYIIYPYFNFENGRNFELYKIEMKPNARLESEPHSKGTEELLVIFEGVLTLTVADKVFTLSAGDAIEFKSDQHHVYENLGDQEIKFTMTVHYAENV